MAQQQTLVLIDDIDGSEAEHTVAFSLDGLQYEIDLSTRNIQRLYDILAPFTTKARKVHTEPGAGRRIRRSRTPRTDNRPTAPAASTPRQAETVETAEPAKTKAPETSTAPSRPQVPAALFSNPAEQVTTGPATRPKPHPVALFSPAS